MLTSSSDRENFLESLVPLLVPGLEMNCSTKNQQLILNDLRKHTTIKIISMFFMKHVYISQEHKTL